MRLRILFGTLGLILGLAIYALLVMRLAIAVLPENRFVEAIFYLVTGIVWIFPAAKLTKWMQDLPPVPDRFGNLDSLPGGNSGSTFGAIIPARLKHEISRRDLPRRESMPIPLLALAASAFAIGTTEFVIMGLLPDVAASLGVSIPSAGLLVTGYALGVVVGAPILTLLTNRWQRKTVLLALMGVFILGNLLCAVAPDYGFLMAARVVTSFAHGSFFGVGSVVAAGLVAKDKQASAIAMMFTGLTLANILGVPFGTLVGQALGWRATFWVVTGLGVVAAVAIALLVPAKQEAAAPSLAKELSVLARPQVWLALLTTVLGFGGVFTVFTYITPILEQVTGLSPHAVSAVLLLFGVGLTLGNMVGGRLADRALMPTLIGVLAVLSLIMALFSVTSHSIVPAIVTIFIWGIAGFATVPPLQMRMVEKAKDAPNLASSLNIGAFNLGNAGGATLGGVIIDHGLNFAWVSIAGALVAAAGLGVALLGAGLDSKARRMALS